MRRSLSISQKILIVSGIFVVLSGISFLHLLQKTHEKSLLSQSRSIAQQIVIFRKWVADFEGVWTKGKYTSETGYLMKLSAREGALFPYREGGDSGDEKSQLLKYKEMSFYLHNPALATRELSMMTKKEHGWTFRVVSNRYMSPQNKPDSWENDAISKILKKGGAEKKAGDEFWGWEGKLFRFAKGIYVKKSCLKCHGSPDQIPPYIMKALRAKYGKNVDRAINYKEGDLRGIISVKVHPDSIITTALSVIDIWNIVTLILALLIFWIFAKSEIIRPVERLTKAAHDISVGKIDTDLGIKSLDERGVRDEITKLAIAIERLRVSVQLAMERLKKKRQK